MTHQAPAAYAIGELLSSEQQYRMDVAQLPRLTKLQEQELAARAQAGEDVRDTILLSLQTRLFNLASKYARYGSTWLDLCQTANLAMLESYEQSVTKQNLFAYLLGVARLAMIGCISGRDDLIKTHHQQESVSVRSLDCPVSQEDDTPLSEVLVLQLYDVSLSADQIDYSPLYQAIESLPEGLRVVIERHYGFGHAPEPLEAISMSLARCSTEACAMTLSRKSSPKQKPSVANARKRQALTLMRRQLAGVYAGGEGMR